MSADTASLHFSDSPYGRVLRRVQRIGVMGFAIACAAVISDLPRVVALLWPIPLVDVIRLASEMIVCGVVVGVGIAAGLEIFWWLREEPRDSSRTTIGITGIVVLPVAVALAIRAVAPPSAVFFEYGLAESSHAFWLFQIWRACVVSLITVVYLTRKRHIFEAETRIGSANREWEYARRAVLEARLQAIQARVEPQLLFDSLARMRERYSEGILEGEAVLEALIEYLRCGLPHMRTATGTIHLECELLKSYALLLRAAQFNRPTLKCDLGDDTGTMTIAAGSLQGLVAPWLRRGSQDVEAQFHIIARHEGGRVRIVVAGPVCDLGSAIASTAQSLRDIHGSRSSVTQRSSEDHMECQLEYPDDIDQPVSHATPSNNR
jgi:hypothetical protein